MISGIAHTTVCVPDVDDAVDWYQSVLGLTALSPPYLIEGDAIERDTHVGLVCEDLNATRADLEARSVRFLTSGPADIAGLRTSRFVDPFGLVFILMEKRADPARPYYRQY